MRFKKPLVIHPYLFAAYPILYLVSQNTDEASLADAFKPLVIALVLTILLKLLLNMVLKNALKAGIILSLGLLMFFSYGHVLMRFIKHLVIGGYMVGRNLLFFPIWSLLFLAIALWIAKTRKEFSHMTMFMNITGVCLVAMSLFGISMGQVKSGQRSSAIRKWNKFVSRQSDEMKSSCATEGLSFPDIYYIILDEYARADILEEYYDFNNDEFIRYLESKGFYVASRSQCNYVSTYHSLSSSLNLDYLQSLADSLDLGSIDIRLLNRMMHYNRACSFLKKMGYTFVFFPSSYKATAGNPEADIVVSHVRFDLTEFDLILIDTSMLRLLGSGKRFHRRRILYSFDELMKLPERKEPTIAFAHITIPHPPFLFDAEGRMPEDDVVSKTVIEEQSYVRRYLDQVMFVNKKMREIIDGILSASDISPVIVVQADHGPRYMSPLVESPDTDSGDAREQRRQLLAQMAAPILNAYLLPDGGNELMHESISPVNSFRVIFNNCFGMNMKLLDDRCVSCD